MIFQLMEPSFELESQYNDYISEWENSGEKIVPFAAIRDGKAYKDLLQYWAEEKTDKNYERGFVPATIYFLLDEHKKIYGAVHIRHELNDFLLKAGGHIGYGVRPSERRKGYASLMLSLALPKAKELGIKRALVTCDKVNLGSARTIIKNGGVLENEVLDDGEIVQRFWIEL
jgi:predicted acetyltransferase